MSDPNSEKSFFDLINIVIAEEEQTARPTLFEFDDDQNVVGVISYSTTCPRCSQLVSFDAEQILTDGQKQYVQGCELCPILTETGEAVAVDYSDDVDVEGADFDSLLNDDGFVDPIASGKMKLPGAVKLN